MLIAAEGAGPQHGHWPEVTKPTPASEMIARPGNGHAMRDSFLERGIARKKDDYAALTKTMKPSAAE